MASESIADIVAEYRADADKMDKRNLPQPTTQYLRIMLERIEAVAKRAYNEIDKAVCGIDEASHFDIDDVRKAMDNTIGEYYE